MKDRGFTLIELLLVFGIIISLALWLVVVPIWTDSNMDFWVSFFNKETINVPFWISWVVAVLLNGIAVVFNIIAEIGKYLI